MASRKLFIFRHVNQLGNAPAHALFERIGIERKGDKSVPARKFADYEVTVARQNLPDGVELLEKL